MSLPDQSRPTPTSTRTAARPARPTRAKRPAASGTADPLVTQRAAFLAAVARDTPGSDLARYTEVLDEVLAWVVARADRVAVTAEPSAAGVIAFTPAAGAAGPRWSLRPVRGDAPLVEILPAAGTRQDAQRERVRAMFNAHSRVVLGADDRLRIGFGALKKPAARTALLALLDTLLDEPAADAESPTG
jgi:hypothetical protein